MATPKRKVEQQLPVDVFPASLEAERAVLRSLMTNEAAITEILSRLTVNDFTQSDHQLVFRLASELFQKQQPIDLVTMSMAYRRNGGKGVLISDLMAGDNFVGNYKAHIQGVRDLSRRRHVQTLLLEASDKIRGTGEVDGTVADLLTGLNQSSQETSKHPLHVEAVIAKSMKRIERGMSKESITSGIPTGFCDYDKQIGGFQPGDLIIIGARPSLGKSALASCIAQRAAERGYPSLIVNAEMEDVDVGTRLLAGASKVENYNLRRGVVEDSEIGDVVRASGKISALPIWVYDSTDWNIIETEVRALKIRVPNLAIVFFDYLTLFELELLYNERRDQQIARITRRTKKLAKDLNIAAVMLAQLSRNVAKESKEPDLIDLRECGDIEQDADFVTFLHRFNGKEPWSVYWLIKKARNAPLGSVHLRFTGGDVAFYDWNDDD